MADYRAAARRAAARYGLDPNVFVRQINQESGFDPDIRSPAGATGIAQIMPATARGWGVDPLDPIASLNAAAKNMASYVKKYGGYENALRAYNAGPGAIEASKGYPETNNYVRTILGGRDPGKLSPARTNRKTTTTTTPAQTRTSEVTTGGDVTVPTLPERAKPTITGPALPAYVRNLPPTATVPDRSAPQAGIREAIAALGKVPQTTTQSTITTPAQTSTSTSQSSTPAGGGKGGSKVLELIFNNGGKGYGIKDGQTVSGPNVFSGVWGGHADHVHLAAGRKTVVALGKVAQEMGLHVGENSHFGGVDKGAHVPGSYHYKDEAVDVSGSKPLMEKFAKYVVNYNKTKRLP